jgi:hypothetical protein
MADWGILRLGSTFPLIPGLVWASSFVGISGYVASIAVAFELVKNLFPHAVTVPALLRSQRSRSDFQTV